MEEKKRDLFVNSLKRNEHGQFVVTLPIRVGVGLLGSYLMQPNDYSVWKESSLIF